MSSMADAVRPRRSHVLVITGITKSDVKTFEEMCDNKFKEQAEDQTNDMSAAYVSLPKVYTGKNNWPIKSNLKCWQCDCYHTNIPFFIPTYIKEHNDKTLEMGVFGHFCTPNCAVGYLDVYFRNNATWDDKKRFIHVLYADLFERRVDAIFSSPDKTARKEYIGEDGITHKQYRKKIDNIIEEHELAHYKLEHFSM